MSTLKTTNIAHPSSASNNIVLDSSGRVGIGTTSPNELVHLKAATTPHLRIDHTTTSSFGAVQFYEDGTQQAAIGALGSTSSGTGGGNALQIWNFQNASTVFATNNTERMRITQAGHILFDGITALPETGTGGLGFQNSTNDRMVIQSRSSATTDANLLEFYNPNGAIGQIRISSTSTAYQTTSDYRLKENITSIDDGVDRLLQLKPARFNFIADSTKVVDGFLAHEVQNVVPEAVSGVKDEINADGNPVYQGIDQSKLVPLLTAALQEAVAKIESLEARLTAAGI